MGVFLLYLWKQFRDHYPDTMQWCWVRLLRIAGILAPKGRSVTGYQSRWFEWNLHVQRVDASLYNSCLGRWWVQQQRKASALSCLYGLLEAI